MVNHLVFQGRMVADPELKDTNSGVKVCNFRVAWSEKYNNQEVKCFLDVKAFSAQAELVCKYFRRGQELVVEGKLQTEEWEKDGQKRSKIVLMLRNIHFCGKKQDNQAETAPAETAPAAAPAAQPNMTPVYPDELPF